MLERSMVGHALFASTLMVFAACGDDNTSDEIDPIDASESDASAHDASEDSTTDANGTDADTSTAQTFTITETIAVSADDANQIVDTSTSVDGNDIFMNAVGDFVGLRFQLDIPQGATIDEAFLEVYVISNSADSPNSTWFAQAADNAPLFAETNDNIGVRPTTTASTNWVATDIGAGYKPTPSLVGPIQEVISRPGWVSGNSMVLIGQTVDLTSFSISAWDYAPTEAAKLTITYTTP